MAEDLGGLGRLPRATASLPVYPTATARATSRRRTTTRQVCGTGCWPAPNNECKLRLRLAEDALGQAWAVGNLYVRRPECGMCCEHHDDAWGPLSLNRSLESVFNRGVKRRSGRAACGKIYHCYRCLLLSHSVFVNYMGLTAVHSKHIHTYDMTNYKDLKCPPFATKR